MNTLTKRLYGILLLTLLANASAIAADLDTDLLSIQQAWAAANYETPAGDAREKAFDKLSSDADAFVHKYPNRAEPLIWQGIVLSTYAGVKGGLGALGLAKKSRAALEAALKIDPNALEGSAYTSLGTLYYKVPGFPLGFGDDDKAQQYLEKALALNPGGIDPNYFYGDYLFAHKQYTQALHHLQIALRAPARPGREVADRGRKEEVQALLTKVNARLG